MLRYGVQAGVVWQLPQAVVVDVTLLQIWTPGEPEMVHSLTSCSRQGQLALILRL